MNGSIGSDFVENTQTGQQTNDVAQNGDGADQFPLLVRNDIQLLKESWANLAEIEDQNALPNLSPTQNLDKPPDKTHTCADANIQADKASPSNVDNEGFKLVTARSTKRIDKAKVASQKNRMANPSSKLALKNLILDSKPDFCFVAEPWMNVNRLPLRWLNRMASDDQQISLSVDMDGKTLGISAVYASNCYIKRRGLWNSLSQLQSQHLLPWSFIGDFNTILGCPMYVLSEKLKILKNNLKTWNKNIFGNVHENVKRQRIKVDEIQRLLDLNGPSDALLDKEKLAQEIETAYFHKLAKIRQATSRITSIRNGDNILNDPNEVKAHIVNHFTSLFNGPDPVNDNGLVNEVIPSLITDRLNTMLTILPSPKEIKNVVFSLNKDSAPGPDGFRAIFFQTYWNIIKLDVINAVMQFFTSGWIMPNFNSNTPVLIPKTDHADSVNDYRPIAMANFKFKLISKIIADRLSSIMPAITSIQQRGFIKGRSIKDCICLTSEAINMLHNKSFGGNLAIKVDIAKAFDTLQWSFLLRVLKAFGFNQIFCQWIHSILCSAKMSISLNGKQHGFFNCSRGVRQGDPLSPLLFCLAEEVISRSITKLVRDGKLTLIKGSRHMAVPSHILYADDIMLFCKASRTNIQALSDLFLNYAANSGQVVNPSKSFIYAGALSSQRLHFIAEQLGFNIGALPFVYLGAPIFKGKPKRSHLQPLADKIKSKLSAWKASYLFMAGRVQLIRSVIQGMMMHTISVYSWPSSLIKDLERWMRNFIWSGDVNQRKLVTMAWHRVYTPLNEGGLGIRSLSKLNEATNLKLCWELVQSNLQWAKFLRHRVLKGSSPISYHIFSSIWSSVKNNFHDVCSNSSWQIGNGEEVNLWLDPWCGDPLVVSLDIPIHMHSSLKAEELVKNITIPLFEKDDKLLWSPSHDGDLSLKDSYSLFSPAGQQMFWSKIVWNFFIPPSKSLLFWRCLQHKLPTDDSLSVRGCALPSMCSLCNNSCLKAKSNIAEFVLLQKFKVLPPVEVFFRDSTSSFLGAYTYNLGISTSLNAELIGAMLAIETAFSKGWSHLWLESDSMLVVLTFSSSKVVPWEGNHCADKLANLGLSLPGFTWWDQIPSRIRGDFGHVHEMR
ncbi:hypothetical protein TSUD_367790 [Trifolium subterraneum]|uniref:Reverse transcriptase domain-containing protein n=1 Tax=Trifolium subterraneum TaxID=3900 RepID=A0A2Z6LLX2_TRISU|nr:hypothetical protein TSUD_367790 [Trifolium subterraneum]